MKSPFSCALHSRSSTSLQLRLNHFSTVAASLNRAQFQALVWREMLPALLGPARFAALPAYRGYNGPADAISSLAKML